MLDSFRTPSPETPYKRRKTVYGYSKSPNHHRIKRGTDVIIIRAICELLTQRTDIPIFTVLVYDSFEVLTTHQMLTYVQEEYPELMSRIHIVITHFRGKETKKNVAKIRRRLKSRSYTAKVTVEAMRSEDYLETNAVDAAYIDGEELFASQRDVLTKVLEHNSNSTLNIPLIVALTASMHGDQASDNQGFKYPGIHQFYDHVTKTHHLQEFLPVRYCSREENCAGHPMFTTFAVLQPVHAIDD